MAIERSSFTKREKEILTLYATGIKHQNIADKLNISLFTMRTHWRNIKKKSNIKTVVDVIQYINKHNIK